MSHDAVASNGGARADTVQVAIALIFRGPLVLITRRPADKHLGGFWEFPGGKCRAGESLAECAEREVLEELGVICRALEVCRTIRHDYPDRSLMLAALRCEWLSGEPQCLEVSEWRWVLPAELPRYAFPPANEALIASLASGELR